MQSYEAQGHTQSNPSPDPVTDFLELLRTAGPAALDHHGHQGIVKVKLRSVDLAWQTPLHHTLRITSDDLLNDPDAFLTARFTSGATVSGATLEFAFDGLELPHLVRFRSPCIVRFQFQPDAARVFAWMNERRASLAHKLAHLVTILLLALAATLAPALGDGDSDDDDPDNDRHALSN